MGVDGGNSTLQCFQLCKLRDKQQKTTICVYKYIVTEPRGAAEELASIGRQIYLRKLYLVTKKLRSRFHFSAKRAVMHHILMDDLCFDSSDIILPD